MSARNHPRLVGGFVLLMSVVYALGINWWIEPFTIGKAVPMRDGNDALIVTTGVSLQPSLAAADKLAQALKPAIEKALGANSE